MLTGQNQTICLHLGIMRPVLTSLHNHWKNSPSLTQINKMTLQGLKCPNNLVAAKPSSAIMILLQVGFFVYALNYGYLFPFIKTLYQTEACMRYTFTFHNMCTRDIFPKEIRMPLRYVCNKCYAFF